MSPAKKKTKKAAPLRDAITRIHGSTVFTMNNVDEKTAQVLVKDHGFRLGQRSEGGATLFADKMAFDSWKGAGK